MSGSGRSVWGERKRDTIGVDMGRKAGEARRGGREEEGEG